MAVGDARSSHEGSILFFAVFPRSPPRSIKGHQELKYERSSHTAHAYYTSPPQSVRGHHFFELSFSNRSTQAGTISLALP